MIIVSALVDHMNQKVEEQGFTFAVQGIAVARIIAGS